MLGSDGHGMAAAGGVDVRFGDTLDGQVERLGRTAGKHDLSRVGGHDRGDLLAGPLDGLGRFTA